jgi:hypothetical protein
VDREKPFVCRVFLLLFASGFAFRLRGGELDWKFNI